MKNSTKTVTLVLVSALLAFGLWGCGKKADTGKSIEQIQTEVQKMSVKDLESSAKAYAGEITSKKAEVEKVAAQLKQFSVKDLFSEKAKTIKDQVANIESEVSALTQRYEIYAKKYQELGGDLSRVRVG